MKDKTDKTEEPKPSIWKRFMDSKFIHQRRVNALHYKYFYGDYAECLSQMNKFVTDYPVLVVGFKYTKAPAEAIKYHTLGSNTKQRKDRFLKVGFVFDNFYTRFLQFDDYKNKTMLGVFKEQ